LLQLDANHGFTNPAQVHNDNPAFGYHPESAKKAWHQALALLTRRIPKGREPIGT
jgi:dienelactone hydrolase